jgi:hypothetical protein
MTVTAGTNQDAGAFWKRWSLRAWQGLAGLEWA